MKAERQYLAHFIDAAFDTTYAASTYVRLGDDLEEFNEELNPEVETKKNILGSQSVQHSGYEVSSEVSPYYYSYDDNLSEKIMDIAMNRKKGDACKTSQVDVLLKADGSVLKAWREDVYVIPDSVGGDTTGVQIPFTVYNAGNRVEGKFDLSTKKFTAGSSSEA